MTAFPMVLGIILEVKRSNDMKMSCAGGAGILIPFLLSMASGCSMWNHQDGTLTGDPLEPLWVMRPDHAFGHYPGQFIFTSGVSMKGIQDPTIAREQAEVRARAAMAQRLYDFCSKKATDWIRSSVVNGREASSGQLNATIASVTEQHLADCDVPEIWVSRRTGQCAALARFYYPEALQSLRRQVNEETAKRQKKEREAGGEGR